MLSELAARLGLTRSAAPAAPAKPTIVNPYGIFDQTARALAALNAAAEAEAVPERERLDALAAKAAALRAESNRIVEEVGIAEGALSTKGAAVERRREELRRTLRATAPEFIRETIEALTIEMERARGAEVRGSVVNGHGDRIEFSNADELAAFGRQIAKAIAEVRALAEAPLEAAALRARIAEIVASLEDHRPTRLKVPRWAAAEVAEQIGAANVATV